jgi:hypothetical protein
MALALVLASVLALVLASEWEQEREREQERDCRALSAVGVLPRVFEVLPARVMQGVM